MQLPNETGIYPGLTREQYDAIDRLNFSKLEEMGKSPAHLRYAMLERPKAPTDPMILGSATHVIALEPDSFFSRFAVWDGERRFGNIWDKHRKENAGKESIREKDYQLAKAMAEAALRHELAGPFLRNGAAEVTILWTVVVNGVSIELKARIDFARETKALADLKTTHDASEELFQKQCWNMNYYARAAWYVDGYVAAGGPELPYLLVAVESSPPHVVQPYWVPDEYLEIGRDAYRPWLERLAECKRTSQWPGYSDGILELRPPRWARSDNDVSGLGLEFPEEQSA